MTPDTRPHEHKPKGDAPSRVTRGVGPRARVYPFENPPQFADRTTELRRLRPLADLPVGEEWAGQATILRREAFYRRFLAIADLIAGLVTGVLVATLLGGSVRIGFLAALPAIALVSKLMGLYDRDELVLSKSTLDEAPKLFQVATMYALLVWVCQSALVDVTWTRPGVLALWGGFFTVALVGRALARWLAGTIAADERCLVIGDRVSCDRVRAVFESPRAHATVVAWAPVDGPGTRNSGWTSRDLDALRQAHDVHRLILAPSTSTGDEVIDLIRIGKLLGMRVSILPRVFEVVGSTVEFDHLNGMTVLGVRRFGLTRSSRIIKRGLDIAGAGLGLLLTAPVFAVIAAAIRLDSPGPVFFRQTRIGRDGSPFEIRKFRTMERDAESQKAALRDLNETEGLFKIAGDPRITRVGRLLRRTSLDELPQLLNVVRGEMSLVGPRPLVSEEDQRIEGWHRRRLHLTPGITGNWQILGSARIPLHEMVKIDYLYVASWSLWGDVKILLRTIPYMLRRQGL
jgi:exopolysaccharide biosynthesis polyprenyl glycosylphosphotransferase